MNHFHLTSLSTAVEKKATGVDWKILFSLCILNLLPMQWANYIHTFKEGFDALGKVGVPRYVLSFRGNLNYRERKEFFESMTGQNNVTMVLALFSGPTQLPSLKQGAIALEQV